jgi:hypothetical protein
MEDSETESDAENGADDEEISHILDYSEFIYFLLAIHLTDVQMIYGLLPGPMWAMVLQCYGAL